MKFKLTTKRNCTLTFKRSPRIQSSRVCSVPLQIRSTHQISAFKGTDQEVVDFYARTSALNIPDVPKLDSRRVVDGQRFIKFFRPIPTTTAGRDFELRSKVVGVYDKGKGTVVEMERILVEKGGEEYVQILESMFYIAQGGWGGPKGDRKPQGEAGTDSVT